MDKFDFSKLESDLFKLNFDESVVELEKEVERMKSEAPHVHIIFTLGRMIGRAEIVTRLLEIVDDEKHEADSFLNGFKKNDER